MSNLPKVLFIIPSVDSGGIEIYLLRFLRLKKGEFNAAILVRGSKSGDLAQDYKSLMLPLVFMPLGYHNPIRWIKYFHFFKSNEFETICDFNANFSGIPMLIARIAGIKNRIVFYRQGKDHFNSSMPKRLYNSLMNKLVFKNSTKILSNSIAGLNYFFPNRSANDTRFKVIYNGVNFSDYQVKINKAELKNNLGIPENGFVIGHTGRLDKAKNHETILKVAKTLIENDSSIYLVLGGHDTEKLAPIVEESGITSNVRLLGYRSDIPALLQMFDVFYFPSITEGQPNSLLEAMASGLTVIASNIEPIAEVFPDKSMLFDPMEIEKVVAKIIQIKSNGIEFLYSDFTEYIALNFDSEARFNDLLLELN